MYLLYGFGNDVSLDIFSKIFADSVVSEFHQSSLTASIIFGSMILYVLDSNRVPRTIASAPAFAIALAASGSLIPPPVIRNPSYTLRTAMINSVGTGEDAPEPDSRYRNRIPIYWAARAYMAAKLGLDEGIPLACPIKPVLPPSPTIIYAVGNASIECFLTADAPRA